MVLFYVRKTYENTELEIQYMNFSDVQIDNIVNILNVSGAAIQNVRSEGYR